MSVIHVRSAKEQRILIPSSQGLRVEFKRQRPPGRLGERCLLNSTCKGAGILLFIFSFGFTCVDSDSIQQGFFREVVICWYDFIVH
jgi:hypothetical protein